MQNRRSFGQREPRQKSSSCDCGGHARLVNRSVHPHGKKSGGVTIIEYVCSDCKNRRPISREAAKRRL